MYGQRDNNMMMTMTTMVMMEEEEEEYCQVLTQPGSAALCHLILTKTPTYN